MRRVLSAVAASLLAATASVSIATPALADKYRDDQWHLPFLEIAKVHKISQGEGVTVAVIDTGVDGDHPDLKGNVLTGFDVVKGGNGNGWGDLDGHGTGMAGLIAAHGHGSDDGALGIAPKAKILPIRIDTGSGIGLGDAMTIAVKEAVKRDAKIISLSVGTNLTAYDAIQEAIAAGVIVVSASGNRPKEEFVGAPGRWPGVVTVGATGKDGNVAEVSVRGEVLSLAAPGVDIVSTSKSGKYRIGTGTSPSAAIVSGTAALVWSKYPKLTSEQVITHLTATATDKGAAGRDPEYGFGVINPLKAVSTTPTVAPSASASSDIGRKLPPGMLSPDPADEEKNNVGTLLFAGAGVLVLVAIIAVILLARRRRT